MTTDLNVSSSTLQVETNQCSRLSRHVSRTKKFQNSFIPYCLRHYD